MIPVSADYRAALRGAHRRILRAKVLDAGGQPVLDVPLKSGRMLFDLSAGGGLRSGTVDVADPALVPKSETDPLAPFGAHTLEIEVGIPLPGGTTEWCTMGRYLIAGVEVRHPFSGMTLTLADLAYTVAQAQLEYEYKAPATASAATTVRDIIRSNGYYPAVTVSQDDSNGAAIGEVDVFRAGTGMWDLVTVLAGAVGCDLFFDDAGALVLLKRKQAAVAPVESVDCGPLGVISEMDNKLSRVGVLNRAVVVHEGQDDATFRAVAEITNGPLRVGGPFGVASQVKVANVENASQATAQAEADMILADKSSLVRETQMLTAPMPHLRPGDHVTILFPGGGGEVGRIQAIQFDLLGRTTISTRWDSGPVVGPLAARTSNDFLGGWA